MLWTSGQDPLAWCLGLGIFGFPQGESVTLGFCCFEMEICFGKWKTVLAGGCPATLDPQMAHQVADSDWEHVHCSRSPAPASGTAGNCFLRVQAPGERSFSVPAVLTFLQGLNFHHF